MKLRWPVALSVIVLVAAYQLVEKPRQALERKRSETQGAQLLANTENTRIAAIAPPGTPRGNKTPSSAQDSKIKAEIASTEQIITDLQNQLDSLDDQTTNQKTAEDLGRELNYEQSVLHNLELQIQYSKQLQAEGRQSEQSRSIATAVAHETGLNRLEEQIQHEREEIQTIVDQIEARNRAGLFAVRFAGQEAELKSHQEKLRQLQSQYQQAVARGPEASQDQYAKRSQEMGMQAASDELSQAYQEQKKRSEEISASLKKRQSAERAIATQREKLEQQHEAQKIHLDELERKLTDQSRLNSTDAR